LRPFGARAKLILADLRMDNWRKQLPASFDAIISATALHWLKEVEMKNLYRQISKLLRPGGIFLNADHVASRNSRVQMFWGKSRGEMRRVENKTGEDWEKFWKSYTQALEISGQRNKSERVLGGWNGGVEDGLPLEWHFNQLKANGFVHLDCFWRCDCDAIYGGFRKG
ncbi:MAG: class I SAM-dependent methyltransferase, partial [Limisphaerales bacterium]